MTYCPKCADYTQYDTVFPNSLVCKMCQTRYQQGDLLRLNRQIDESKKNAKSLVKVKEIPKNCPCCGQPLALNRYTYSYISGKLAGKTARCSACGSSYTQGMLSTLDVLSLMEAE